MLLEQVDLTQSFQTAIDQELVQSCSNDQKVLLQKLIHENATHFLQTSISDVKFEGVRVSVVHI